MLPVLKEVCAARAHAALLEGGQVFQAAATRTQRHLHNYHRTLANHWRAFRNNVPRPAVSRGRLASFMETGPTRATRYTRLSA